MKRLILIALATAAFAAPAFAAKYEIDPTHTQVQFGYSHFGFSNITGRFDQVTGQFELDTANLAKSSISIEIPVSSISTGVDKLDQHLLGADFFDVAKYPAATFKSRMVHVAGPKDLHLMGDLTIRGVTKPVAFAVKVNGIGEHPMRKVPAAGFDATAVIKRSDFGLGAYVPAVGDEVTLRITLEAFQPKP